jgi:hypothetical integral membrane protein (TIGR02206 family)
MQTFFAYNNDFQTFSSQHITMLAIVLAVSILLPFFAKRVLNPWHQLWLSRGMAILISFWVLVYILIKLWLGDFNYKTDLPLDICNIIGLLLPFLMWKPSYKVHEVLYFWILAGTLQANITPHLFNGFPNYIFFKYWIVHGGLIVYAVYITVVFDFKPTLRSVWKAFFSFQLYLVFIFIVNILLRSNYVYVLHKPPTATALDYLGPWPWYILVGEILALLLFFLVYAPIRLAPFFKKN